MKNKIEEVRSDVARYFDPSAAVPDSDRDFISPSGLYLAKTVQFKQTDPKRNWTVTRYDIYDTQSVDKLFTLYVNHDVTFHNWFTVDDKEYLVCAEDIYGGQTIIDLTNRIMSSFSSGDDGFISTEFHLSHDNTLLITFGCFWGGPCRVKVLDFRNPMILPWPEIPSDSLFEDEEEFVNWEGRYLIKVSKWGKTRVVDVSDMYNEYSSKSAM